MNRSHAVLVLVILAMSLALVAGGKPTTGGDGLSELQRADVSGASNLEVVMRLIERPGNRRARSTTTRVESSASFSKGR